DLANTPYAIQLGLLGAQYVAKREFALSEPFRNTPTRSYFPETSHSLGGGFLIYWRNHGGLRQFGYPLSEEFVDQTNTAGNFSPVQFFERARFEWPPEFANTRNEFQIGLLGRWALDQRGCGP